MARPTPPLLVLRRLLAAAFAAAAGCTGCASGPREPAARAVATAHAPARPLPDRPGLRHLGRVDEGVWRCAQPTVEGFAAARALGVRTVLNLRSSHDDRPLVEGTGLVVVDLPTTQGSVGEEDLVAALRILSDPARRPVLVHCQAGRDRTGVVVAAYRRVLQGWSAEDAVAEMAAWGAAPWWPHLPRLVRALDPGAVRARLGAPPPVPAVPPAAPEGRATLPSPSLPPASHGGP